MFKRISNSSESRVIGVNNGVYQVELNNNSLENDFKNLLTQVDIEEFFKQRDEIFKLSITLKGKLLPKAKVTDVMGYSPHFFGFNFIISQKVVDCLKEERVPSSEFHLLKVDILGLDEDYYLFYVPWVRSSEIIFSESLIYRTFDVDSSDREYFDIQSYEDYIELQKNEPFNSFDKVVLDDKYKKRSIISIQGITELLFKESLVERMVAKNVSSFEIKKNPLLSFSGKRYSSEVV